jgi:hypothetical protein
MRRKNDTSRVKLNVKDSITEYQKKLIRMDFHNPIPHNTVVFSFSRVSRRDV